MLGVRGTDWLPVPLDITETVGWSCSWNICPAPLGWSCMGWVRTVPGRREAWGAVELVLRNIELEAGWACRGWRGWGDITGVGFELRGDWGGM